MINTIWGTTAKPESSKQLALQMESIDGLEGTLYIGYPIIGTPEGPFPFDALLLSPTKGVIAFSVVEGKDINGNFEVVLDECYNKLHAKLLQYATLTKKRQLAVNINTILYAPAITGSAPTGDDTRLVATTKTLPSIINTIAWDAPEIFPALAASIQAITTIRKGRKRREAKKADSRGARLRMVEDSIANLDAQQSAAVIETVAGVQRIRGLAGSGKTIVLALKVAYLHARHPEWKIAVTFNTRSLKGQFERLINTFVIEQTNEEPDWDQIDIINAWGAPGGKQRDGVYYKFCTLHGLTYYDFRSAEAEFGTQKGFAGACEKALDELKAPQEYYDVILVDEAQDFTPHFLRLCYIILKQPKRLVYAYDELQNLTRSSLPSPEELFGSDEKGEPYVVFSDRGPAEPRQDVILEKCYRNPGPLLATAHALGFGIYRDEGLIQLFEQKQLWLDVGYTVQSGSLAEGQFVSLARTENTSPKFLERHSSVDDLIQFKTFNTDEEQIQWLVDSIVRNIREEELDPEDIIVINPDPLKTRSAVSKARALLLKAGINSSLAGVTNSTDIFFESDSVTFTGIFRAKGNEAAMVYIVNGQDCYSSFFPSDLSIARNRLFTAITRSKAWVRILGTGPRMAELTSEYYKVKNRQFQLEFVYPTEEQRKKLQVVNRDMTKAERGKLRKQVGEFANVLESLEAGEMEVEDLPPSVLERLTKLLDKNSKK